MMTETLFMDNQWGLGADLYDLEQENWAVQDLDFYLAAASQHAPVLELACGTGRLTIPLAQAGISIVGLDVSAEMLAVARAKAPDLPNLTWVQNRYGVL